MAYIKNIFKLFILVQFLAFTFATYGNPDAEFIDFASPSQPSRDQMIIEAAIKRGMDGEAVAELLRTRQPVVRTTTTPSGFTKTTTYKLEPDGSISSKSILQKRNRYVYNSGSIPDELKNSPTGTVTRTFTDSDGSKVTQTIAVNRDKSVPVADADWFSKNFGSWPGETPAATPPFSTSHRTVSRTFTSPHGERTTVQSWSSEPETPFANTPSFRRTSTRTFTKPSGERHVIQTTSTDPETFDIDHKPKSTPNEDFNWSGFDDPAFSPSWPAASDDDTNGWELIDEPEVTTRKAVKSWTPKTWQWPEFPTHPTTTASTSTTSTSTTSKTTTPSMHPTPKPLPSLEDFLKSQYGSPTNRDHTTSTAKTSTYTSTPKHEPTTTPKSSTTTTKYIKIEDLPAFEMTDKENLPDYLSPNDTVLNIEQKHPIEEDMETAAYTPKLETNVRSYSKTHIGPEKPRLKDLDPQMQDILKNAGIVPEIEGDTITKTRTEPDGRVITTTYKVKTLPSAPQHHYIPSRYPAYRPPLSLQPLVPHLSPIADFLANLGLTKFDITSQNGRYTKTLIDENGDVLTATFVLTSSGSSHKLNGRK